MSGIPRPHRMSGTDTRRLGCSRKRFSLKVEVHPGIPDCCKKPRENPGLASHDAHALLLPRWHVRLLRARPIACSSMRAAPCAGWTHACQQAAHTAVLERKAHRGGTSERLEKAAPIFCHKILAVHGQRDVDPGAASRWCQAPQQAIGQRHQSYLVCTESFESMSMTQASGPHAGSSSTICCVSSAGHRAKEAESRLPQAETLTGLTLCPTPHR